MLNSKLEVKFGIWADLVPLLKVWYSEQGECTNFEFTIWKWWPCPTIEVLCDFMMFGTKGKLNILIDIHCLDSGHISF